MGWGGGEIYTKYNCQKEEVGGGGGICAKYNCQTEKGGIYKKNNYQSGEGMG